MSLVSAYFGRNYIREVSYEEIMENLDKLRELCGDRAVLRAIHVIEENERVVREAEALKNGDFAAFLKEVQASGNSSYKYLQNVYSGTRVNSQSLSIGLALADLYLKTEGAYRVHGGGFEGTIQLLVPQEKSEGMEKLMTSVFGQDCLLKVKVRPFGTITVI